MSTTPVDVQPARTEPTRSQAGKKAPFDLMFWVPIGVLAALFVVLAGKLARPITDPDTWWHLRMGEEFSSGRWTLWEPGQLSSFGTQEWVPRDWLPQLAFARIEDWWGLPGVAWVYGATAVMFALVVYLISRRWADPLPAALAAVCCVVGAGGSISPRPQLLSFILLAVIGAAWMRTVEDRKPRWWLIPLMWVWACSHGMWYAGVAIGVAAVTGMAMDRSLNRSSALRLSGVVVACLLVGAVTPVGPRLLPQVVAHSEKYRLVTEWAPPNFLEIGPAIVLGMVMVVLVTGIRRRSISWAEIAIVALALAWTVMAARSVALGAVLVAPLFAHAAQEWVRGRRRPERGRREIQVLLASALVAVALLALLVPSTSDEPGDVPNGFNEALEQVPDGQGVLNEYALGGWLSWRHPDLNQVVDGFTDAYSLEQLVDYGAAHALEPGWREYVADTGATIALLDENSPLAVALQEDLRWRVVARDGGYVYLEAPQELASAVD